MSTEGIACSLGTLGSMRKSWGLWSPEEEGVCCWAKVPGYRGQLVNTDGVGVMGAAVGGSQPSPDGAWVIIPSHTGPGCVKWPSTHLCSLFSSHRLEFSHRGLHYSTWWGWSPCGPHCWLGLAWFWKKTGYKHGGQMCALWLKKWKYSLGV